MPETRVTMTARAYIWFIVIAFVVTASGARVFAEGDVTIVAPPSTSADTTQKTASTDGTPVVHKSLHKKKSHAVAANGTVAPTTVAGTAEGNLTSTEAAQVTKAKKTLVNPTSPTTVATTHHESTDTVPKSSQMKTVWTYTTPGSSMVETEKTATVPTVETDMPVARYQSLDESGGPIPASATFSRVKSISREESTSEDGYSTRVTAPGTSDDFVFTNFSRRPRNIYPWKTNIITTIFWIGEGGTTLSSTTNVASSWDEDWVHNNRGRDDPEDRNGYAPASHAPTLNPFYIALPFNDLAFPEKAREWLPAGWYRKPKDGKQVSACKDRWVQIKNAQGRSCYAQWEDVGPLRYDHAEYVFGDERPDTYTRAGLDVSPAVAQYLGVDGNNRITSWRFVDAEDVPPGAWLKYDEQAVIFAALEAMKNNHSDSPLPIQRSSEPIDDPSNIDTNKKKVGAAKG